MEMPAVPIDPSDGGVHQRDQRQRRRQRQHDGGQAIQNEHDAERRGPVAHLVSPDRTVCRQDEQRDRHAKHGNAGREAYRHSGSTAAQHQQHGQRRSKGRQRDRRKHQLGCQRGRETHSPPPA
jgi:hypothetical protein